MGRARLFLAFARARVYLSCMAAKPTKCPWPKPHMRDIVKRAIDKVGGQRGFDFMGRGMQEAIIDQACFQVVQTSSQHGSMSFDDIVATRRVMYEIAGLWSDED